MTLVNYYRVLGVARTASLEEIRKAFYKLAKVYHPDMNFSKSPVAAEALNQELKFKEIQEAYKVLGDPVVKQEYDMGVDVSNQDVNARRRNKVKDREYFKRTGDVKVMMFNEEEWQRGHGLGKYRFGSVLQGKGFYMYRSQKLGFGPNKELSKEQAFFKRRNTAQPRNPWK